MRGPQSCVRPCFLQITSHTKTRHISVILLLDIVIFVFGWERNTLPRHGPRSGLEENGIFGKSWDWTQETLYARVSTAALFVITAYKVVPQHARRTD